jgi:hypothetical protein
MTRDMKITINVIAAPNGHYYIGSKKGFLGIYRLLQSLLVNGLSKAIDKPKFKNYLFKC